MILMVGKILEILALMIASGIKFVFAPSAIVSVGYSFWQTIAISTIGGCLGVLVFFHSGKWMVDKINKYLAERREKKHQLEKARKWFTKRNRWIVRVKTKYGPIGIAIITPSVLSIPLGSIIAAKYCRRDNRTLLFLLLSVVLWSFVITAISVFVIFPNR